MHPGSEIVSLPKRRVIVSKIYLEPEKNVARTKPRKEKTKMKMKLMVKKHSFATTCIIHGGRMPSPNLPIYKK